MLVLRYFLYVGGALVSLLLLLAAVMPKAPIGDTGTDSAADVPAIRIHSQQKWPERVVFDTNAAMPAPAKVAQVAPMEPQAAGKTGVREAFAQAPSDEPKPQAVTEAKKPDPKPVVKRRVARARPPQQYYPQPYYNGYPDPQRRMQVAQQPRFGFFW
jgi:hypothetical protein